MDSHWIPIKQMAIPKQRGLRVLLYTPVDDHGGYRICDATDSFRLNDATHWQPLLAPQKISESNNGHP